MLKVENIQYSYKQGKAISYPSFEAPTGQAMLIMGPSGSGKTTLLHLLAGLLPLQAGQITIGSTQLSGLNQRQIDAFRGQHIGLVLQQHHFVPSLNAAQNIKLATYLAGKKLDANYYENLVNQVGIKHLLTKKTANLSVGEQQRVSIVRGLINKPDVLLADEPTSSLDDANCQAVAQLLLDACAQSNTTLVIVTHDERLKRLINQQIALA